MSTSTPPAALWVYDLTTADIHAYFSHPGGRAHEMSAGCTCRPQKLQVQVPLNGTIDPPTTQDKLFYVHAHGDPSAPAHHVPGTLVPVTL